MEKLTKILLIALLIIVGGGIAFWKFWPKKTAEESTTTSTTEKESLLATMLAFNLNDGLTGIQGAGNKFQEEGWNKFRNDSNLYSQYKTSLEKLYQERVGLVKQSGFRVDREITGLFTWNVIEPEKGTFDWELTDLAAKYAREAGVKFSAVVQPFASWDQAGTQPIASCTALDFAWYDYKAGPPKDTEAYKTFLTKLVERYKDMVAIWEIGNEYDGQCGGYQNNPQGYFELVKISSETIKEADPQAKIANGGASELTHQDAASIKSFWQKFFELGGGQYLDYFNLHYNSERSEGAKSDPSTYLEHLTYFNDLMANNGGKKPIIVTEIGTYSGTPSSQMQPPGGGQQPGIGGQQPGPAGQQPPPPAGQRVQGQSSLPTQSENFQAAWYFKYSILSFADGAELLFIDLVGQDNDVIGGSAMFNTEGKARQFLTTLKTINAKIAGFSKSEKIADGQYKFTVGGKTIYALWAGSMPAGITGQVKVTDYKGQEQTMDSGQVQISSDKPIFVEVK